jgi:hypothetical protein
MKYFCIDEPSPFAKPAVLRKFLANLEEIEQCPEVEAARKTALENLKWAEENYKTNYPDG